MINDTSSLVNIAVSILFFPMFFQENFLLFAWGAADADWVMLSKRLLLLLPVAAIILACWASVGALISVIVRADRKEFVNQLLITWWDLGKAIVSFWGGIFKFAFYLGISLLALLRIAALGVWSVIQDILFTPFRLLRSGLSSVTHSRIPWIAVGMTLFWCTIEAIIFTYVMTPLIMDTFANITGEQLAEITIRIPLFIFMLFIVLGSYAVLSTYLDMIKTKNIPGILGVTVIEIVVMMVEVVFLYREFVDALVPWFAQYSNNFEPGVMTILGVAVFAWFGIRSVSWFLFASHGTPVVMSVIRGKGFEVTEAKGEKVSLPKPAELTKDFAGVSTQFMDRIHQDAEWVRDRGEELLGAFMLPPLQIVAAAVNFCTLVISGRHLFQLPFRNVSDIIDTQSLFNRKTQQESVGKV